MHSLIPTPKIVTVLPGRLRLGEPASVDIQTGSPAAHGVRDWLAERLAHDHGVNGCRACRSAMRVCLCLPGGPEGDDVLPGDWRSPRAFASGLGREQGYVLEVREDGASISALTPHGLQHGAATLLQVLRRNGEWLESDCCRIEDWPDLRFRAAADWLLNAEINLWGYERGGGREATLSLMKRKLDQAAAYKINVVWFDGVGWDAERTPWYAEFARELSEYARLRHIRLAFVGYGGGYGFAYQACSIYYGRHHGRVFENRESYPDGEVYDCVGHPGYPTSWHYGTCLSNAALAEQKLAELTDFVARCRPGVLYIHDVDTGGLDSAHAGWKRRCGQCRARWPDDAMASPHGAAGAYAGWFRQVSEAVNAVESGDGEYAASRDCQIVFVGPVYSTWNDSDEVWQAQCEYFAVLSESLGPVPNVEFGIREQLVSDEPAGLRVPMLGERLEAVGNGHGVFVVPFVGGDNYYSDQLVSTAPAMHNYWRGASMVYTATLSSVAEPMQLLSAQFAWNADAPGAYEPAGSRREALELLQRCRDGVETPTELFGPEGLLRRACDRLYGRGAGESMAELFSLGAGEGVFPLATGWRRAADEVTALTAGPEADPEARAAHWRRREELTRAALQLAGGSLRQDVSDTHARADIGWLRVRLEVGGRMCRALAACWRRQEGGSDGARTNAGNAVEELSRHLSANVPGTTTDPVGGDLAVWRLIADQLRAIVGR